MPIQTDTQDRVNSRSVIDPYHPDNRIEHSASSSAYVFRTRTKKVKKLNFTLGWELEANHAPTRTPNGVQRISDGSVNGDGSEFIVLPAITKSPKYVLGLLKELVHAPKLNTDKSCGYHVHVGASNITLREMHEWAVSTERLALLIEEKAFKAVPDARQGNSYCRRITPITNGTRFSARKYDNQRRYHWLNTVEIFRPGGIRTLENRLLGNTHRWKYVLAWSLFSMELARLGWELKQNPLNENVYANLLKEMLEKITVEIKPLEKRHDAIPQWVYEGLGHFGIAANSWDRPLAKLGEIESDIKGLPKKYYSDNQATEANESNDDDDNTDYCECGCGNESRCDDQMHSDGDCDTSYCERCHENGDCTGRGRCDWCITNAHNDGESCGRDHCSNCERRQAARATPVTATESNIVIHQTNTIEPRTGTVPITAESMRRAVEFMREQTITPQVNEAINGMVRDTLLFGTHQMPTVWLDESNDVRIAYQPISPAIIADLEHRAMCMLNMDESIASNRRESEREAA